MVGADEGWITLFRGVTFRPFKPASISPPFGPWGTSLRPAMDLETLFVR